jgi:hypothetical protein
MEFFCFRHRVQIGSAAQPASYPKIIRGFTSGVKWPGREDNYSPPPSAEVNDSRSCISSPLHVFMAWCSVKYGILLHALVFLSVSNVAYK